MYDIPDDYSVLYNNAFRTLICEDWHFIRM